MPSKKDRRAYYAAYHLAHKTPKAPHRGLCALCGQPFESKTARARYCRNSHRVLMQLKRKPH